MPVDNIDPAVVEQEDPQKKKIDDLMEQIGLHPSQVALRQNLGLEEKPPAPSSAPLLDAANLGAAATGAPPVAHPTGKAVDTSPVEAKAIPPDTSSPFVEYGGSIPGQKAAMTFPSPSSPRSPIINQAQDQVSGAQKELARLNTTGSGIHQIKNPFLRTLARVGDIAGTAFFPGVTSMIPGTELHHRTLMNDQERLIDTGLSNEKEQAGAEETQERTKEAEKPKNELDLFMKQNPNASISDYWNSKTKAEGGKKSPDQQVYEYYLNQLKMTPDEALKHMREVDAEGKPDTKEQSKQAMQELLQKALPVMDPKIMSSTEELAKSITQSGTIDAAEKGKLMSYFVFNSSPASQGTSATIRGNALEEGRIASYLDTKGENGPTMVSMNAKDFNEKNTKEPGRYVDSKQGQAILQKDSIFKDIYFNIDQTREALKEMAMDDKGNPIQDGGFTAPQRAQIAFVLKNSDPRSALDSFLNSSTGKTLNNQQVNYITALASLQENALALRGIAGLGQGSDELRAAIMKTLPGAGTPTAEYAGRQLDLFHNTVDRLHTGVAKMSNQTPVDKTEKTEPEVKKRTLSRAQVEAAGKKAGMSYEDAKKDAEAHGIQVVE